MTGRSGYRTRQKEELTEYLMKREGTDLTAAQLHADFGAMGLNMGMATIYRHLDKLVEEGTVRKYTIGATNSACYEFIGLHEGSPVDCFHCKCENCGKLIHLRCEELVGIQKHIDATHGFAIDPMRTVFYGICADCRLKIHA